MAETNKNKYEIKRCSIPNHYLLVDAETGGSNFSLQMPLDRAKYICLCVNTRPLEDDLLGALEKIKQQIVHGCGITAYNIAEQALAKHREQT